jgi:RHS repeat-associated protein
LTSVSYLNPQSIIPPAQQPIHRLPQFQPAAKAKAKEQHHANPNESFRWDARGNPVSDEQRHSAPGNRLAFYADRHFEYDRFGNLIAERRGKDHKLVTLYEYDCRHRLIRLETPDGSVSTYAYDAFNRRLSKTVNGKLLEFVWRGNQLVAETDGKGYWQSYLYEPGSYRPMALVVGEPSRDPQDKPPAIYWYQNDHLGTPHELTDWKGNAVWKGRFSAFGQMREEWLAEDASAINQPLRFQGQYADKESGHYYNLNRYYDPGVGRYVTADPIGLEAGLNGYQYVDGNPVSWIDPLGLSGLPGCKNKPTGDRSTEPVVKRPATGADINESVIQNALMNDSIKTVQEEVSLPAIQRYYDRLLAGETPPAVKMDGDVIVDGNHRYVAGKIFGKVPNVTPGVMPMSKAPDVKPVIELKIDPDDWGNR